MKKPSISVLVTLVLFSVSAVLAQAAQDTDPITRPRTVGVAKKGTAKASFKTQDAPARKLEPEKKTGPQQPPVVRDNSSGRLSPNRIQARIDEAKRMLKSRPHPTAMTTPALDYVTLAAMLPDNSHIHLVRISKEAFLTKGSETSTVSSLGLPVTVRVVRANGVNTAVTIFDDKNRWLMPLVVEYPIERRGVFREMAYYTSAHPSLLSNDLTKAGQLYVNSMVDLAAKRLKDKGFSVTPNLIAIAKRLCIVEHVDHDRFRNENRIALFDEIYSLYALNELETYRYSVSSAGAGGMVQMIPWTYKLMRQRHPGIGLNPDFVLGMRNHGNALEAMLLYMQDTWNDLVSDDDVQAALSAKQATPTELMAAGYNSNAAKIPGYIRRAGSSWRTLIPRETQIYLQIYQSLDVVSKAKDNHARRNNAARASRP
ncbi:MAG TPA: hypothetical protein VGQ72_05770 [Pyrinomonadaceae bacterium]|nr:hypothetical protein [Pyrinomonadaceae bacterium]